MSFKHEPECFIHESSVTLYDEINSWKLCSVKMNCIDNIALLYESFTKVRSTQVLTYRTCAWKVITTIAWKHGIYILQIWGSQINQNFETVCIMQRSVFLFRGQQPNFQNSLQNFEVAASRFKLDRPQWPQKQTFLTFQK